MQLFSNTHLTRALLEFKKTGRAYWRDPPVRRLYKLKLLEKHFTEYGTQTRTTFKGDQVLNALESFRPTPKQCNSCKHRVDCMTSEKCIRQLKVGDFY